MNVFFEESGNFKAGTVLSRQGEALQVELPGGRRAKVKTKDVLVEFDTPAVAELMRDADVEARQIELDFLWECAPPDEFGFMTLAAEYFGGSPSPVQRAALVLCMHAAPIYFRRKGRGQYMRAPVEQLQAALAALERRLLQAGIQAGYEAELKQGSLPAALQDKALQLLTKPDKNTIEYKALEAAAGALGVSAAQLMLDCGGIESPRALHEARFLADYFPHGIGFPLAEILAALPDEGAATFADLPDAGVEAFSVDDVSTTEIDDAFSVQTLADGRVRIGVHIAAPALGIVRGDAIDLAARTRLSTVYVPGDKITMLPAEVVDIFTLKEGSLRPALSLYVIIHGETQEIVASETRVERVFVKSNLRHNQLDAVVTEDNLAAGAGDYPHKSEIAMLWPFANALHEKRQQARAGYGLRREVQRHTDFNFHVDGEHISITPRRRGSPLDLIVAELAILANSAWGAYLDEHGVAGIYRSQRAFGAPAGPKRTRMQTTPAPHEGLGVAQYAWSTSPLRRYIDLVNQWQLVACVQHGVAAKLVAPFKPKDVDLFAVVQNFDDTYTAYADHQRRMEHFWCLRWIEQEHRREVVATVLKGDVVRLEEVPLLLHVAGLGVHARGTRLLLEVVSVDELRVEASCRLLQVLGANTTPDEAGSGEQADDDGPGDETSVDAKPGSADARAENEREDGNADEVAGEAVPDGASGETGDLPAADEAADDAGRAGADDDTPAGHTRATHA